MKMYLHTTLRFSLLLLVCIQPSALKQSDARRKHVNSKSKQPVPVDTKSPDAAQLKREHPTDPVKWFNQVNVHFKAGDKAKVRHLCVFRMLHYICRTTSLCTHIAHFWQMYASLLIYCVWWSTDELAIIITHKRTRV
jgi:hypothetical protein